MVRFSHRAADHAGTEFDKRLGFLDRYLIVLERPFLASSLANSVRSALRARARQLEVKSYIEQKEEVADGKNC